MKQFSQERKSLTARACALLLAATFTLSPVASPAQIGEGSLDDMWAENQQSEKPAEKPAASEASDERPSKKSRKPKKLKGLQPPQADGDLLKSTDQPTSGWDSPGTGSADANGSAGDLDSKKSGTATAPTGSTSTETTSESSSTSSSTSTAKPSTDSPTGTAPTSSTSSTSPSSGTATSSTSSASPSASTKPKTASTPETESSTPTSSSVGSSPSTFSTKTETSSSSESTISASGPMQPLCKLASLQSSDLVKSGGWPGVGPFAQDKSDSGALVDDSKNRLKFKLSGEDVTHAELLLVNQSPKPSQLLAIQMTANFLLEAVGAQPGKIADFNNDMMKNQEKLSSATPDSSVNLKAGTYVVQIQKKPAQESTVPGNVSFLIALDNQKPSIVASAAPKTTPTSFSIYSTPTTTTTPATTTTTTPPKTATSATTTHTPTAPKTDDLLHKQFSNLISSWQQVKRSAVKTRQAASLSRILGGKALATQNRAVEWLNENKRYYEMTPVELKVLNYKEITPGAKYEIETFIKERQQLISADTMKVEKDTTQAYNVVYTVEKIRGAWLITDTRMVKPI